ncbi:MAG TPA: STAS domain-containing protein [Vicinamibacterales bacterium]
MTIVREPRDDTAVVHVEGSLRAPVSAELRPKVQALLRRGKRKIVVSLAGVSDLDAAGVGELVHAYNVTVAANGILRITQAFGRVRELLARVGLLDLLHVERELPYGGDIGALDRQEPEDGQGR